jgi:hypothetical protein
VAGRLRQLSAQAVVTLAHEGQQVVALHCVPPSTNTPPRMMLNSTLAR